ncbi:hypothetical protein O181_035310 [Austropuccinia psidii MF-1]|uniref:Uncharacterized protein n=1 Tax=Austropuccinia psidii MF-1 TaxID=1389203 RepID=A0A9Q3HB25_9BASI|nr:hypothetical protein [Austropuccinia psidii MF-1]
MSREKCQIARNYLIRIITLSKEVNNSNSIQRQIPKDVRTVIKKLDLTPELNQYVCCPKCYFTYDIEVAPHHCQYKNFPNSPPCGAMLFCQASFIRPLYHVRSISTHYSRDCRSQKKQKPSSIYVTQDFSNWLKWFVPQNEDLIEDWENSLVTTSDTTYDYQQSPAWEALYPKSQQNKNTTTLKIAFSLFTDWFNPLSNKAAGKQVSLGVLALNCLNLPPTSQWKVKNTFISGLVPEPSQPNMVTINNILSVFINEMIQLNLGIFVQTSKYLNVCMVVVCLGFLIGDLVANHKVSGFASHLATRFCSWCECPKAEIQQLKLARLQQQRIVKDYSLGFKDLKNEAERTRMVKKTGISWSELNQLGYWDPVQQIPLGIMHNWFEGILQHHFRSRWRWDFEKVETNKTQETDNDSEEDCEIQDSDTSAQTGLSWEQGQKMMSALMDITVLFGVTRIPLCLGQAKEGKVKASEWQFLFSIHLPLAAIDTRVGYIHKFSNKTSEATNTLLLIDNLCALVACTHILESRSITNSHCLQFTTEYKNYFETSKKLFQAYVINPNHHYALHSEIQLRRWGPLIGRAKFCADGLNGFLQGIPTSGKTGKFGVTIMKYFCQWKWLMVDEDLDITSTKKASDKVDFEMDHNTYIQILSFLQITTPNLCDYSQLPHPEGENVFLNYEKERSTINTKGYLLGNAEPNNMIQYNSPHRV